MYKCGACGKFLSPSSTEAATCKKCSSSYHRLCVAIKTTGPIATPWYCPECKKNLPRDNKAETPVRERAPVELKDCTINPMDTSSVNNTASDITRNVNLDVIRAELNMFKEDFLNSIKNEFRLVRDDLSTIRSALNATNDRISELESRVTILENQQQASSIPQLSNVDNIIAQLRSDINDRDQELLANDVQISNLPASNGENPTHTIMVIASKLGVNIEQNDIVSVERIGGGIGRRINATQSAGPTPAQTRPPLLVARFARRDTRDQLLDNARTRRGMTSADLDMLGPAQRFYINERLTKQNRDLFRRTREASSKAGWQYAWTKRGRILARNKPGDPVCRIRGEADLQRLFEDDPTLAKGSIIVS